MKKSGQLFPNGAFTIKGVPPLKGKLSLDNPSGTPFINYSILIEYNGQDITRSFDVSGRGLQKHSDACNSRQGFNQWERTMHKRHPGLRSFSYIDFTT